MRCAVSYLSSQADEAPWLIVGKGPSAAGIGRADLSGYLPLTLNHACLEVTPALAHFCDVEALDACAGRLGGFPVVLPWHPHEGNSPSRHDLSWWAARRPVLAGLEAAGLLFSYNSTVAWKLSPNPALRRVRVRYFSGVAAFNLLAEAGVWGVRSVGLDGGRGYAPEFDPADMLANGRDSFDCQEAEFSRTCREKNVTHTRLAVCSTSFRLTPTAASARG